MKKIINFMEQKAQLNYLRMAPRKVRLVASLIKGMTVNEAEAELRLQPRRAAAAILKLLRSAMANAKNNKKMDANKLMVKLITVNQGPMLKRFLPRARGSASPIQKKSSHVTIILEEKETIKPKFYFAPKEKKEKKEREKDTAVKKEILEKKKTESGTTEIIRKSPKEKESGFLKRFFRRKSV